MSNTTISAETHENRSDVKEEKTSPLHLEKAQEEPHHGHISRKLILTTLWVACASFAYGFSGSCIGGVLVQTSFAVKFQEVANLNYVTGVVSIYHAAGFFGVVSGAYISDRWGRRVVFLYSAFFYTLGAILLSAAQNLDTIFVGRMFIGGGAYGFLFSSQTYIVELSPATSRGLLGATVGLALEVGYIVAGTLPLAGWMSYGLSTWLGTDMSWRLPFILQFVPLVPILAFYRWAPESPRWLCSKGRSDEALEVLIALHASPKDVNNHFSRREHRQIELQYQLDRTLPSSWLSMFTTYRRRTSVAALVMFSFLLGGDYFLATYGPQLFIKFGYTTQKSLIYQAAWLTLLILNFAVMPLIDRVGRKMFLVVGLIGEGICLIILMCLTKYFGDGHSDAGRKAFVAIFLVYMLPLCFTEPPAYLLGCEIFPLHIRTKGTAIAYAVTAAASTMVARMGWKAYLLFIVLTGVNIAGLIIFVPETKNVPLEEMARLFGEGSQVALNEADVEVD